MVGKSVQLVRHVLPAVVKPLRVLWNQIVGFLFIVLGLWAVPSTVRHIREFDGDADSLARVALTGVFVLFMTVFGITSFLRARKISRT